jgi:hypothetical protein
MWPMIRYRCPTGDRGSPGRTYGNAVPNPRIRVCPTVVLAVLPPAPRNSFIFRRRGLIAPIGLSRPNGLTTNIRVHARQLAIQLDIQILRRYCRPLLRGLEQTHRSAVAHHVHRDARVGPWIMNSESWYNTNNIRLSTDFHPEEWRRNLAGDLKF